MNTVLRIAALTAVLATGVCSAQTPKVVDATLTDVTGSVRVNQGDAFEDAVVGTKLKRNDRVMAMDDSSARVSFFEGCEVEVEEGTVVVVPDQLPCDCLDFSKETGPVARVAELVGTASMVAGPELAPVDAGRALVVGDVLQTGPESSAVIEFRDGCREEVGASSEYRIPDSSPCACAIVAALPADVVTLSNETLARIFIPPLILIPFISDDDGPISP